MALYGQYHIAAIQIIFFYLTNYLINCLFKIKIRDSLIKLRKFVFFLLVFCLQNKKELKIINNSQNYNPIFDVILLT